MSAPSDRPLHPFTGVSEGLTVEDSQREVQSQDGHWTNVAISINKVASCLFLAPM